MAGRGRPKKLKQKEIEAIEEAEEQFEDELEDDAIENYEADKDLREDVAEAPPGYSDMYGAPSEQEQHNLHSFLTGVLKADDRIKTSFLTVPELGKPVFSVRFWLNIASYSKLKGFDLVHNYAIQKAKNTTDTGLSREGFIINTSVTQKKVRARHRYRTEKEGMPERGF